AESFRNWRGMSESGGRRIKRAVFLDQSCIRFLSGDERRELGRIALIREHLDRKRNELGEWNTRLGAAGREPVNARRLTNIGLFRAYVLNYLRADARIAKDMTLIARQLAPTPQGLPLEIYCFTATTAWVDYEDIQADIFDHLLAILPEFHLRVFQEPSGIDLQRLAG